jgi:predicted small secreted protein
MRRRMTLRRHSRVLAALLMVGVFALTGCENTRENDAGREGLPENIGHIDYNVYITRELNLRDVEDRGYYQGPEAPPGFALYGVFVQACNTSSSTSGPHWMSASNFQIEDTQGNKFRPLRLPGNNIWAYRPQALKQKACIPQRGSLAANGPTSGSLLIFRLPLATLENRPLDLRITAPPSANGERDSGLIELDI